MSLFMVWVLVGWGLGGKELRFVAVQELRTLEPVPPLSPLTRLTRFEEM